MRVIGGGITISSLRTKLLVGLAPLVAIMVGLGLWAIVVLDHLGGRIKVILKENYESVLAAEGMKEALERMDSAAQFAINGQDELAREQFQTYRPRFERQLDKELHNITLPGEQELATRLKANFEKYLGETREFYALPGEPKDRRWQYYSQKLLKTFNEIKDDADRVLFINQANMKAEDRKARESAARSERGMVVALVGAALVATLIAVALSRSLLEPVSAVTQGARALAQGNLDQLVPVTTRDELGELALAFNSMARTIREYRAAGTASLLRAQKTAQATIDSFPDPVVVVDPTGALERANPAARRVLGVMPPEEGVVPWDAPESLKGPLADVLGGGSDFLPTALERSICLRDDGHEKFLLPRVLAIRGGSDGLLGAAVVLLDVTKFRLVDQIKSDMVATVSHELKTPLTGLQMVIHLLLEETIGPLHPKQLELLVAARQDADRLLAIVNDLLDLARIEQGRLALHLNPVAAADLVAAAVERYEPKAWDLGLSLKASVAFGMPPVLVDRERIEHVFDNLVGNALDHTGRGGAVELTASVEGPWVVFTVKDNGEGIPPEFQPRIFERFFRVPGSKAERGAGLGLAITREIITAHGGKIGMRSEPGQGTTFTFTLPVVPQEAAEAVGREGAET
jgi:signal transduction histidine kinase